MACDGLDPDRALPYIAFLGTASDVANCQNKCVSHG